MNTFVAQICRDLDPSRTRRQTAETRRRFLGIVDSCRLDVPSLYHRHIRMEMEMALDGVQVTDTADTNT